MKSLKRFEEYKALHRNWSNQSIQLQDGNLYESWIVTQLVDEFVEVVEVWVKFDGAWWLDSKRTRSV